VNGGGFATTRRTFLAGSAGLVLGGLANRWPAVGAEAVPAGGALPPLELYKAVKWGMIAGAASVAERFKICKELGYDGMELISPIDATSVEVRNASHATGLPVHGLVNDRHWEVRLSSPDAMVREQAVDILRRAIQDAHDFGGSAVLLVPGRVSGPDENHDHVWQRSIVGIRQTLTLASRLGVRILIENVWNGFCEDAEQMRDYLDEISSPWVGAYFDIGNAVKFGPSEHWIRTLGSRIVKLDVKDWSRTNGFDAKIGDGDVHWPEVRQALREIRYSGWCTAEVAGGDRQWLADVAARMDRTLRT
jgi:hexulose-6-phosphate isomerase